jgi:hypothetical protein
MAILTLPGQQSAKVAENRMLRAPISRVAQLSQRQSRGSSGFFAIFVARWVPVEPNNGRFGWC